MMNKMNNAMLMTVCGGNNGDAARDNNQAQSKYQVGQWIEHFTNFCHVWTNKVQIKDKKFANGHWNYKIKEVDSIRSTSPGNGNLGIIMKDIWITANDIERK